MLLRTAERCNYYHANCKLWQNPATGEVGLFFGDSLVISPSRAEAQARKRFPCWHCGLNGTFNQTERMHTMRKDALTGCFILAMAMTWLSVIPGRVAAN